MELENKLDLDQIKINANLEAQIKEIQTEFDFDVQTAELDLIESKFINEPFYKIEKGLLKYDFQMIKQSSIADLRKQFLMQGSKILTPDMITTDFLLEIMPKKEGKMQLSVNLLYQHS